jgi:hypothetical protein
VVPSGVPAHNSADELTSAIIPALHPEHAGRRSLSYLDADLQSVIAVWERLPAAIRKAIVSLASSQG